MLMNSQLNNYKKMHLQVFPPVYGDFETSGSFLFFSRRREGASTCVASMPVAVRAKVQSRVERRTAGETEATFEGALPRPRHWARSQARTGRSSHESIQNAGKGKQCWPKCHGDVTDHPRGDRDHLLRMKRVNGFISSCMIEQDDGGYVFLIATLSGIQNQHSSGFSS